MALYGIMAVIINLLCTGSICYLTSSRINRNIDTLNKSINKLNSILHVENKENSKLQKNIYQPAFSTPKNIMI